MSDLNEDGSKQAVLKLANEIARLQEARDVSRQIDHDILIEIKANLQWIREKQDSYSMVQSAFENRLVDIEKTQNEQKGAWKGALAAGSIGGAFSGLFSNFIKH